MYCEIEAANSGASTLGQSMHADHLLTTMELLFLAKPPPLTALQLLAI